MVLKDLYRNLTNYAKEIYYGCQLMTLPKHPKFDFVYAYTNRSERLLEKLYESGLYSHMMGVDVKGLKHMNELGGKYDKEGRGDKYLNLVISTLNNYIREGDKIFNRGGDEFLVLFKKSPKYQASSSEEVYLDFKDRIKKINMRIEENMLQVFDTPQEVIAYLDLKHQGKLFGLHASMVEISPKHYTYKEALKIMESTLKDPYVLKYRSPDAVYGMTGTEHSEPISPKSSKIIRFAPKI